MSVNIQINLTIRLCFKFTKSEMKSIFKVRIISKSDHPQNNSEGNKKQGIQIKICKRILIKSRLTICITKRTWCSKMQS